MDPILIRIPDACRLLGVGRSMFYKLITAGEIKTRKIGRKTLVPREELTAFAARLAVKLIFDSWRGLAVRKLLILLVRGADFSNM